MNKNICIGLTKKLSEQLKIKKLDNIDIYSPNIRMWHAGFKYINRKKSIIFMNDLTSYSFLLYGVKQKELMNLDQVFLENLYENLKSEKLNNREIFEEMISEEKIEYIKTNNRSILGMINNYFQFIPYYLNERQEEYFEYDGQLNMTKLNKKLNRYPGNFKSGSCFPIDELKRYFKI